MNRVPLPGGVNTYLSLSHASGSVIDHVISNSTEAKAAVSSDGSFIGDHFPLIGSLKLEIRSSPIPVKRPAKLPPSLRAGDTGGLRRLNDALKRKFVGNLEAYSVEEITE